ncbi:MAG TPA: hypothetical protein DF296_09595 [Candidatus Margulisbacteria bacterium]|nr:hypothetical protein [Candidatus Margulisiibacteriota bacterium]HCT85440.1 hypothetical protein [Candidatus Margulisiibacteriota bacterium]
MRTMVNNDAKLKMGRLSFVDTLIVALFYYIGARVGLFLVQPQEIASPIWISTGIALAAVLLRGYGICAGVFLGSFFAEFTLYYSLLHITNLTPILLSSAVIGAGAAIQASAGAYLIVRIIKTPFPFRSISNVFKFIIIILLSCLINSTIGAITNVVGGFLPVTAFCKTFAGWWLGDFTGAILFAPFILTFARFSKSTITIPYVLNYILFVISLIIFELVVFTNIFSWNSTYYPIQYMLIFFIFWGAFKFNIEGVVTYSVINFVLSVWGTINRIGPFGSGDPALESLLLQGFLSIYTIAGLILTAAFSEMKHSESRLIQLNRELESQVQQRASQLEQESIELDAALSAIADGLIIYDTEGRIKRMNPAIRNILRYDEAVFSLPIEERMAGIVELKTAQGNPLSINDMFIKKALKGESVTGEASVHVFGTDERYWIHSSAAPIRDQRGAIDGVIITFTDLTRLKQVEDALYRERELLQTIIDSVPVMINIFDPVISQIEINKYTEELLGWTKEEVLHMNLPEAVYPDPEYRKMAEEYALSSETGFRDFVMIAKDGTKKIVSMAHRQLPDGRLVGIGFDVRERKKAEEKLQELTRTLEQKAIERTAQIQATNEELESVIYSMSHDLYSPLRGISGYAGMLNELLEKSEGDQEARLYADRVQDITKRMEHMISAIKFLLGVFKDVYPRQETDLSGVFTTIANEYKSKDPKRTGEFIIEPDLVDWINKEAITEVLKNLISNSWKYTVLKSYKIEFGRIYKDGKATYYVRDNGIGFDNKYAEQIFRPFYQLGGYPTGETGYGVGLTVVHAIIRKHLGEVWAEGAEGRGAIFYFTLGKSINDSSAEELSEQQE